MYEAARCQSFGDHPGSHRITTRNADSPNRFALGVASDGHNAQAMRSKTFR